MTVTLKYEFGRLRRDDDGHWYLVPEKEVEAFDDLSNDLEGLDYLDAEDKFVEFEEKFGHYRVDGYQDFLVVL